MFSIVVLATLVSTASPAALDAHFTKQVRPFVDTYCVQCHGNGKVKGNIDFTAFGTPQAVIAALPQWTAILDQLKQGDMPPEDAKQPTAAERAAVVAWIQSVQAEQARKNAGDPGVVPVRRLSNSEFDYSVRELTGVDIRPGKTFPIDPANEAGFDNTAESLNMSPALLAKYYEGARLVADHMVLTPQGIAFAPHPVTTETERDQYCVNRIVQFYQQQPTNFADYFFAAWQHKHGNTSLSATAERFRLSAKYLNTIWKILSAPAEATGPLAALQAMWQALPPPGPRALPKVRSTCEEMARLVRHLRKKTKVVVPNLRLKGANAGAQALVLWKDRQMAAGRRSYGGGALNLQTSDFGSHPLALAKLKIPRGLKAQERYEASFVRFANVFPDAFLVKERGRVFLSEDETKDDVGRFLSAGFHNQMGYFRDDAPLYDLVLSKQQQQTLDDLWQQLDFVASVPARQHASLIWFERSESSFLREPAFDFARAEDKEVVSEEKFARFANAYYEKARRTTTDETILAAVKEHFERTSLAIRRVEQARKAAEPVHMQALLAFARRAFRRPLSEAEQAELSSYYLRLRTEEARDHEEAMRDVVTSVLLSPSFLYRLDLAKPSDKLQPLDDFALASRLSYFLWSGPPDEPLLATAAGRTLSKPSALAAQARRMMKDERAANFATEFVGHWLDIRRFEEHNAVDRTHFTSFTNDLRSAMFEEPLRFFTDLLARDGSILDLLHADHTFVNAPLAKHYGMPAVNGTGWVKVNKVSQYGRGGLLPMAAFLTKNAPGLRTSPVKRGYFVVHRVLGERVPPPPANVPELPSDESKMGELTLRESLAKHRDDKACAGCHMRFDNYGLVFENYGPVGERRNTDLGGHTVDTKVTFIRGETSEGLVGLKNYIKHHRQGDFVDNFCRKLLAFGLGRSLIPSDDLTIARIKARLAEQDYKIGAAIDVIVQSPQFRNKRG